MTNMLVLAERQGGSWESSDKLVQIKEFFQTDRVQDPHDNTKVNDNTIAINGDDGKQDESHAEQTSARFKEAFKVEREKEAENLRKMKEKKLDLAYSEFCKDAISDENFSNPQLVSVAKQSVIVKIRKKASKEENYAVFRQDCKSNSSIEKYSVKDRSQLQISTERQQWKQQTLPNIHDLGTDDDTIICQIISGSETTEKNENTNESLNSHDVDSSVKDNYNAKHGDAAVIEDPRHELLSVLGINNGEFLKNDLLPKLVLGSEDRKSVFKGRLSLFQIIPEVKLVLDAGLDHENLYKELKSFVTKESFPLQKYPPHIDLVPHELVDYNQYLSLQYNKHGGIHRCNSTIKIMRRIMWEIYNITSRV